MTTPDPDFTPSNAQNGYGKHLASSLPPILFPILVFALEREGLRIPTPQLTEALNLGNLVINNLNPEKGIEHKIIALLKCIERYFTHIAKSRNAKISDLQNQIANLQAQLFTSTKKNAEYAERFLNAHATPSARICRRITKNPDPFDASEKNTAKQQKQYTDWRTAIVRTFIINEEHFATEFRKIQHIAGLFKENAYRLFEPQLHFYNEYLYDSEFWH
jgi:bacterioferritin (cytochrome b1)